MFFSNWSENRYAWFLFGIIMSTALFVSISASFTYYYNPDEAWYYHDSLQTHLWESIQLFHFGATHPPLGIIRVWLARNILDGVWFIRLTSVFFYLGSGFCAFYLGRIIHSPLCGAIMAGLLMYATAIAEMSISLRGYIILVFFLLLGLICYYRYIKDHSLRMLFFYSVSMSLAVLSEYLAIFIIFAYGVSFGLYQLYHRPQSWIKTLILWAMANSVILGCFLASYLTQGEVLTANVGWAYNGYYSEGHSIIAIGRIVLIPLESGFLSTFITLILLLKFRNIIPHSNFNIFQILLPFILILLLSFVLDFIEAYPVWKFQTQLRFTTHLVIIYSLLFAYLSAITLPKLIPQYRLPVAIILIISSLFHTYSSKDYEEWRIYKNDIIEQVESLKSLPEGSTVLLDEPSLYIILASNIKMGTENDKMAANLGKSKIVFYPKVVIGFGLTAEYLNKFLNDQSIDQSNKKYILLAHENKDSCPIWMEKYTRTIVANMSGKIVEILPTATPESLDTCK